MTILEDTQQNCTVLRETKGKLPGLPFVSLKQAILGTKYSLTIIFATSDHMQELSVKYKGDPTHMNVLSFPYDKTTGEIFINLKTVRANAPNFEHTYHQHLLFLVIHGMLHLKGLQHGRIMEEQEARYFSQFSALLQK